MSKSPGLIRRISNRATTFASKRRQSSTVAKSRDHSTGPVFMRRRSDSNGTVPDTGRASIFADSDDEDQISIREEIMSNLDGTRDPGLGSTNGSIAPSITGISAGPVIPGMLLQGTILTKVSRKKKKVLTFVLDKDAAKVSWDKSRPWKSFYIDDIKEIRVGRDARNYRQEFGIAAEEEPRFFSILYAVPDKSKGRSQKVMHLIAGNDFTFELWTTTLDAISKHRHDLMVSLSSFNDKAVKTHWRMEMDKMFANKAHSEDEEDIDMIGLERLCRNLHINVSSNYLQAKFNQADASRTGRLNFAEFQDFIRFMKQREDVRPLYREYAQNSFEKGMLIEEFFNLLRTSQMELVDKDRPYWENVFAKFVRRSRSKDALESTVGQAARMNEAALTSFLTSPYNVPTAAMPAQVVLDRPLNEYFISSSHNTYLLGRQVAGESSVEAYISALARGCRCVEVDCWNGAEGPVVTHGHTATTSISFADVMSTIAKYAFVHNSFPVFVSLEVHCNPEQQAMMAEIIKGTCGTQLVTEPLILNADILPSPSELLNRILIKVKAASEMDENTVFEAPQVRKRGSSLGSYNARSNERESRTMWTAVPQPGVQFIPTPRSIRTFSRVRSKGSRLEDAQDSLSGSSTSDSESFNDDFSKSYDSRKAKKTSKIIKVLGDLGVYCRGQRFAGFDALESKNYNHIFSFMEQTFAKHSRNPEEKRALVRHNMRYLMRVYPSYRRIGSNNFDPLTYWRRGVQMVALNWQTYDTGVQINDAMFAAGSDQTGYVLKPVELRGIRLVPGLQDPSAAIHTKRERRNVNFSIDVISAQQLMRPRGLASNRGVDPYVEVEVFHADDKTKGEKGVVAEGGVDAAGKEGQASGLGAPHRRRTQIVSENGFNPVFNEEMKFSLATKYPDLVFVRFSVRTTTGGYYNDRNPALATHTVKLNSLKQGYRTLPLVNNSGERFLFSTLFCRIKIGQATTTYFDGPEAQSGGVNMLKSIGRNVFNRTPMSPKRSMDNIHT